MTWNYFYQCLCTVYCQKHMECVCVWSWGLCVFRHVLYSIWWRKHGEIEEKAAVSVPRQICRAGFGLQSADSCRDEPGSERGWGASDCWARAVYGSVAFWFKWPPKCSTVFECVGTIMCVLCWVWIRLNKWECVGFTPVCLCFGVQDDATDSITVRLMFGP